MKPLTITKARTQLFRLVKDSVCSHRSFVISSREGRAVLLSEEDYENLLETLELQSTPGFVESVKEARRDIKKGRTYSLKEVFGHE